MKSEDEKKEENKKTAMDPSEKVKAVVQSASIGAMSGISLWIGRILEIFVSILRIRYYYDLARNIR